MKKILVTSALPYANGSLHLGHLLEFIQTDIWVRYNKLVGHECLYLCADDAHGTAIMLKAQNQGITPDELVAQVKIEHCEDLSDFAIAFDNYHSTHSKENKQLCLDIYHKLLSNGYISTRRITQLYDDDKKLFLADRFISGTCPKCSSSSQYGDNCEVCSATYNATELINPRSTLSNSVPILKESEHYFFQLDKFAPQLKNWLKSGSLQNEVANKLNEWMDSGLQDWDITRDAPYFGFTIPDSNNKYFYVWLDAPIGYMSSLVNLLASGNKKFHDIQFNDYWLDESKTEIHHFIGKDIIYFHGLFWPAMLSGAGFRLPTAIHAHGFVTVNGTKMSKSRGTFITAKQYLEHLNPENLRYYFASKLTSGIEDIDINFADFTAKNNSDLVGKVINIASRCSPFIHKHFDGYLATVTEHSLITEFSDAGDKIAQCYSAREYRKVTILTMQLADKANQYIDTHKPWKIVLETNNLPQVHLVCSVALNLFKILMVYLQPIIPITANKASEFLCSPIVALNDKDKILQNHKIAAFTPLMTRITPKQIATLDTSTH